MENMRLCRAASKKLVVEGYACGLVLLSPSVQYSSVCICVSRDTVLWKANLSSSPLKIDRLLASSWFTHKFTKLKKKKNMIIDSHLTVLIIRWFQILKYMSSHPFQPQIIHQNVALIVTVVPLILDENIIQWMIR